MRDFAFYNAGCERSGSWKRSLIVAPRRLLRRLLRPIFQRQEQIDHQLQDQIEAIGGKSDGLAREVSAVAALGWDHVALTRRLAMLEDEVERLRDQVAASSRPTTPRPHVLSAREAAR